MRYWQLKKGACGSRGIYAVGEGADPAPIAIAGFDDRDADRTALARAELIVAAHNAEVRDAGEDVVQRLLKVIGLPRVPTALNDVLAVGESIAIERGDLAPFHELEYLHERNAWAPFRAAIHERVRQISVHGFTAEHDDEHADGQLADGAAFYALSGNAPLPMRDLCELWRFSDPPSETDPGQNGRKREIAKSIAMLAAEYSRLEREEASAGDSVP